MKLSLIDLLIYLSLFIFVACFPVDLFGLEITYELIIKIGLRLILFGFYIYFILKNKAKVLGHTPIKEFLLFLPFFLICFSNIFSSLIGGGFNFVKSSGVLFFLEVVLCLLSAILEEIVFRFFIHSSLVNKTAITRIVLSALIFAACHLINIVNVRSVDALLAVLLQTVYTFGLGLVLGFIFEYTHSLIFVIILHFSFNFFNDVLYRFLGGFTSDLAFVLTAVVIALLACGYGILLYFKKYKNIQSN